MTLHSYITIAMTGAFLLAAVKCQTDKRAWQHSLEAAQSEAQSWQRQAQSAAEALAELKKYNAKAERSSLFLFKTVQRTQEQHDDAQAKIQAARDSEQTRAWLDERLEPSLRELLQDILRTSSDNFEAPSPALDALQAHPKPQP